MPETTQTEAPPPSLRERMVKIIKKDRLDELDAAKIDRAEALGDIGGIQALPNLEPRIESRYQRALKRWKQIIRFGKTT